MEAHFEDLRALENKPGYILRLSVDIWSCISIKAVRSLFESNKISIENIQSLTLKKQLLMQDPVIGPWLKQSDQFLTDFLCV